MQVVIRTWLAAAGCVALAAVAIRVAATSRGVAAATVEPVTFLITAVPDTARTRIQVLDGDTRAVMADSVETIKPRQHQILFDAEHWPRGESWIVASVDGWPRSVTRLKHMTSMVSIVPPAPTVVSCSSDATRASPIESFSLQAASTPIAVDAERVSASRNLTATVPPGRYHVTAIGRDGEVRSTDQLFGSAHYTLLFDSDRGLEVRDEGPTSK